MQAGYFNVGRNIRTVNDKPDGSTWNVGIADPEGALPNGLALIYSKGSFSFVTSGDYERFYIATDGKKVLEAYKQATGKEANAVWVMDLDKKQGEGKETNGYYVVSSEGLKDIITY